MIPIHWPNSFLFLVKSIPHSFILADAKPDWIYVRAHSSVFCGFVIMFDIPF